MNTQMCLPFVYMKNGPVVCLFKAILPKTTDERKMIALPPFLFHTAGVSKAIFVTPNLLYGR